MKKLFFERIKKYKKNFAFVGQVLVFILLITQSAYSQKKITGEIISTDDKLPIPGVSVLEKGTSNGAITDMLGKYEIQVNSNEPVLVFSFMGYATQEIIIGSQSNINIELKPSDIGVDEVVVVGYGAQKKTSMTGAVTAVDVKKIDKIPGGDISTMLSGQVAGVNISMPSGAPGSTPQILIRGLGSITSSNPLVVIDGIPGDISFINPSDIESINVLKDASASTIYGSRASNGVIIITTKKGKKGDTRVSLKTYMGIHNATTGDVEMANRDEYNLIHTQALTNGGEELYPWITDQTLPDSKWGDAFLKQGIENKYDLSIIGGNDNASYSFSGGYYKNTGTVINTGYDNYSSRLNTEFKLFNERLKISPSISYNRKTVKNMYEAIGGGNGGWSDFMET